MFSYDLSDTLRKRLTKLGKKDPVLALIFRRKVKEIVSHDTRTIDTYKNLRSPHKEFKRIHLTNTHVLLFTVDKEHAHIIFVDILAWNQAYK